MRSRIFHPDQVSMRTMTIKICATVFFIFCFSFGLSPALQAAEFAFADAKLTACVNTLAKKYKWENVEAVDKIVCHNASINSLTGIEQFVNVEKLSFHKNHLTKVKLVGLHKLRELNLARNKLQKLELADLPALENLYFFGNRIPKVTLENLPSLQQLKANSSDIREFSYAKLPKLEKIYLFDNQLETIDINNLPAMKYMDVRQNPMPDELYEDMDKMEGVTILHDGNAEDWQ